MIKLLSVLLIGSCSAFSTNIRTTFKLKSHIPHIAKESISQHSYFDKLHSDHSFNAKEFNELNLTSMLQGNSTNELVVNHFNILNLAQENFSNLHIHPNTSSSINILNIYKATPPLINVAEEDETQLTQNDDFEGIEELDPDVFSLLFKEEIQEAKASKNALSFADSHKKEIEQLYETKHAFGDWKKLGEGESKTVFTHKKITNWLIKIPINSHHEISFQNHKKNLEYIKKIARNFDRIVLPKSYLYHTDKGVVILEEKFNLESCKPNLIEQQKVLKQFYEFKQRTGLCDVLPTMKHNAGIIAGSNPSKMGIIDFDCIEKNI